MAGRKRHKIKDGYKVCTICNVSKHVSEYHSNGINNVRGWCKSCDAEKRRGNQQKWKDRKNKEKTRDPIKEKARNAVREAVRSGKIKKPSVCPECKKKTEVKHMHGHHYKGYEYKLDIKWLCRWCHAKEHSQ